MSNLCGEVHPDEIHSYHQRRTTRNWEHAALFPESDWIAGDFVRMLMQIVTEGHMARDARRNLFRLLKVVFPSPNAMPSYPQVAEQLKQNQYDVKRVRTCPNNCVVFDDTFSKAEARSLLSHYGFTGDKLQYAMKMFGRYIRSTNEVDCPECGAPTLNVTKRGKKKTPVTVLYTVTIYSQCITIVTT